MKMFPALLSMLPGILGSAGGAFGLFGNKGRSAAPMNAANQYINQIPGQISPYYKPYMDAGTNALNTVTGEYGKSINDPAGQYNKFASGYKESPGYKTRLEEAMRQITNAQAAGGMAGSGQHQQYSAEKALELSGKDFEDYLTHIMGIYNNGMAGEQGIENQGYDANTDFAHMLANIKQQQGQMAYSGAEANNNANSKDWSSIFGGLGNALGGYNTYSNNQDILKLLGNWGGQ